MSQVAEALTPSPSPEWRGGSDASLQLSLGLGCGGTGKTVLNHRYMAYPLSVSPVFRLEENGSSESQNRAYLYRMNTSPGLLAGDRLAMNLQLSAGAELYLADQAATKVHSMSQARARVDYRIELGDRATLEFLPEPLILFTDSALTQKTEVIVQPSSALSLGEIILPGRLARGESYQFRECLSRIEVKSPEERVWFIEAMKLRGKNNRFSQQKLFTSGAVLGSLILILPEAISTSENLATLSASIDDLSGESVDVASSVLPEGRGLFVRAMAQTTREMQACFKGAVNGVRKLRGQLPLPYSV